MNAQQFAAAITVAIATFSGSAMAAETPKTNAAAAAFVQSTAATTAATAAAAQASVNVAGIKLTRTRAEVHAEAVEFVKNHKTAFEVQMEQFNN